MRLLSCFLFLSLWHAFDALSSELNCREFKCAQKILLFAIEANTGKSAMAEFNKTTSDALPQRRRGAIPDLFRSSYLDNLPEAIKQSGSKTIVTEFRKNNAVVAKAVFDVTKNVDQLNSHNWFTASRLIKTYPYWTGNSASNFVDMSIDGHRSQNYHRSFYIHHTHGACETDNGLMGIGENSDDKCKWVADGGKPPILFYSKAQGAYKGSDKSVVDYADHFLVYLTSEQK